MHPKINAMMWPTYIVILVTMTMNCTLFRKTIENLYNVCHSTCKG